jgi:hypothetical protein
MRVNFVGFSSLNAKNASGISINISFKNDFYLSIDSTDLRSVKVNYLLISFVDCGSCTGYPYYYN